jgi:hypothetical protein
MASARLNGMFALQFIMQKQEKYSARDRLG